MSYLLPHLHSAWDVDRTIVLEETRVVVLRFGHDEEATCMRMDETLASLADDVLFKTVALLQGGRLQFKIAVSPAEDGTLEETEGSRAPLPEPDVGVGLEVARNAIVFPFVFAAGFEGEKGDSGDADHRNEGSEFP
jgi:hypothetical protein